MLLSFAEKQDLELAKWIEEMVRFLNSILDRITLATKDSDSNYLKTNYGIIDE